MSSKLDAPIDTMAPHAGDMLRGGVIELVGTDAAAFAQAQLMNDVRLLGDRDWQWTGWLSPKGRVTALAALLRLAPDRYWLLLPDHPAAALCEALQRYVFRSRVKLTPRPDLGSRARWDATGANAEGRRADLEPDRGCVRLDLGGERPRSLLLGEAGSLPDAAADDVAAWRIEDLAHGLPRVAGAELAAFTPQMLGLSRLNAYSVRKGCYPGQEIVSRTHFLGQAKRGLRRLESRQALVAGASLADAAGPVGEVLCAASHRGRHEALAVFALDHPGQGLVIRDGSTSTPVNVIGFAEGLAR